MQAIDSVPYLSIPQLEATHSVESVQGFGMMFAMFNQSASSPFADQRARQAFLYALDVEEVIGTGLQGQATAATCFVQEEHPAYKKASTVYSYDADKAKSLLAEAGITTAQEGATHAAQIAHLALGQTLEPDGPGQAFDRAKPGRLLQLQIRVTPGTIPHGGAPTEHALIQRLTPLLIVEPVRGPGLSELGA